MLENRGFARRKSKKGYLWVDPNTAKKEVFEDPEKMIGIIEGFDCVVMIEDHPLFDEQLIRSKAKRFVDCRTHKYLVDPKTRLPVDGQLTAMQSKRQGDTAQVATIYTGVIPIVYKAQNQLLRSLINSIALAFVMIAFVMMLLLRNWRRPVGPDNLLNVSGGMLSMLPTYSRSF